MIIDEIIATLKISEADLTICVGVRKLIGQALAAKVALGELKLDAVVAAGPGVDAVENALRTDRNALQLTLRRAIERR